MVTLKYAAIVLAAATFVVAQSAGAVGLPDVANAHTGKQLKNTTSLGTALESGKTDLVLRLRYENVHDSIPASSPLAGTDNADMWSLRAAAGYTTARYYGFYGRVQIEGDTRIGSDNALNLNGDFTFPPGPVGSRIAAGHAIIPDNPFLEFNEAFIGWRSANGCMHSPSRCNGNTTVKVGRQTIAYDNQRWVGAIGWRQNNQSFDAVRIDNTSIPNLGISYVYLDKVNRLFGSASVFDVYKMNSSQLINVSYRTPIGKLVGYGYLLNFDDNPRTPFPEGVGAVGTPGIAIFDSDTWGMRLVGKHPLNGGSALLYELEGANQKPTHDAGPTLSSNNYYDIEVGGAFKVAGKPVVVKLGREILEGNGVNAVQTPLATVHAFNGWADKFIGAPGGTATPAGGLEDTSLVMVAKGLVGPSKLVVQYHDFRANTVVNGIKKYGTEWDVLFAKPFTKHWLGLVKYANYNDAGQGFSYDTRKYWVMAQYTHK